MTLAMAETDNEGVDEALIAFAQLGPSWLLDHRQHCCWTARDWFAAMDRALTRGNAKVKPPAWLGFHFQWGPARWPIYWCEAIRQKNLDCGGLAALARVSFDRQGVKVLPAQVVLHHERTDIDQWCAQWTKAGCSTTWIHDTHVYHEVVAVIMENSIRVWDPTESVWVDPILARLPGCVTAIRVVDPEAHPEGRLKWGEIELTPNSWVTIQSIL